MATDTQETNEDRKTVHYGYAKRQYLEKIYSNYTTEKDPCYIVNEDNKHILLMSAVESMQTLIMLKIKMLIYGNIYEGFNNCDAFYFNYNNNIMELCEKINKEIAPYNFRVFLNSEEDKKANLIYQNYEDLLTREEKKALEAKLRRAAAKKQSL